MGALCYTRAAHTLAPQNAPDVKAWLVRFRVAELARQTALALLVPLLVGYALDRKLGIWPWASLAGVLLGIGLASAALTRTVLRRFHELAPPPKEPE